MPYPTTPNVIHDMGVSYILVPEDYELYDETDVHEYQVWLTVQAPVALRFVGYHNSGMSVTVNEEERTATFFTDRTDITDELAKELTAMACPNYRPQLWDTTYAYPKTGGDKLVAREYLFTLYPESATTEKDAK